ncbi:hypothetical protein Tco_0433367 [Tanacetum coccineum]
MDLLYVALKTSKSSKKVLMYDMARIHSIAEETEAIWQTCRRFEEKEATFEATVLNLRNEVDTLNLKLIIVVSEHTDLVKDIVPHCDMTLLSYNDFSLALATLQKHAILIGMS